MLDIMEFIKCSYKKMFIKIQNLSFIHFIPLKFFETTEKCLLFSNSLGSSYK